MPDEPRPEFPIVRKGYDRDWVDAYLDRVNGELVRLASDNRLLRREDARREREALDADVDALRERRAELTAEVAQLQTHADELRVALGRLLNVAKQAVPPGPPPPPGDQRPV
jgi:DivIVA domain-containing protein